MNHSLQRLLNAPVETNYHFPSISIFMPFEPKMKSKRELVSALETAVEKVEAQIFDEFSVEMAVLVLQKLKLIVGSLNFSTHQKSIAIYVSPVFEKILYLNRDVREKILVSQFLNIRDLVMSKRQIERYMVLQITGNKGNLYADEEGRMTKIFSYSNQKIGNNTAALRGEQPAQPDHLCERCQTDNFLRRIDNTLHFIISSYEAPFFLMGKEGSLKQFTALSSHVDSFIDEIKTDYEGEDMEQIKKIVSPYTIEWNKVHQKFLAAQLKAAAFQNKYVSGIADVFKSAMNHNGRLLLVEEHFAYPANYAKPEEMIYKATRPYSKFSYMNDAVDEVIEKVLDQGGDVEFVEKGFLAKYDHIALIL